MLQFFLSQNILRRYIAESKRRPRGIKKCFATKILALAHAAA